MIYVTARMVCEDTTKDAFIDTITLTLPKKGKYQIISDNYQDTPSNVDYSSVVSGTGGMYKTTSEDDDTYYFRGAVNNNYFSFANYTWKIERIDENSNIKLVMNDLLKDSSGNVLTKKFKNSNTASTESEAKTQVKIN